MLLFEKITRFLDIIYLGPLPEPIQETPFLGSGFLEIQDFGQEEFKKGVPDLKHLFLVGRRGKIRLRVLKVKHRFLSAQKVVSTGVLKFTPVS